VKGRVIGRLFALHGNGKTLGHDELESGKFGILFCSLGGFLFVLEHAHDTRIEHGGSVTASFYRFFCLHLQLFRSGFSATRSSTAQSFWAVALAPPSHLTRPTLCPHPFLFHSFSITHAHTDKRACLHPSTTPSAPRPTAIRSCTR
jgi:hypothetical protein